MAKFASATKQAASVAKILQQSALKSVGTVRNYEQALVRAAEYCKSEKLGSLRELTLDQAYQYLENRGHSVGQKTLDMDRQAVQSMFQHVTGKLPPDERLTVIKSETAQVLTARAYTSEQVDLVSDRQTEPHSLATQLAHAAGLRAHELLTLEKFEDQPVDDRPALESKFDGREGVAYSVTGKGGLTREIRLSQDLSDKLESRRFDEPQPITDRGIHYQTRYDVSGGIKWSKSFSAASTRALGWSAGAHGLRHSYAQDRVSELQSRGLVFEQALETVSQEMGHFRPDITKTYLR